MAQADGVATLELENSYIGLTDILDAESAADANTLEIQEASLRLRSNSTVVVKIDG
ncbi:MAG: hypothetical protein HRU20_32520, partial [Pseudomonadales bacterium]|nr:hypothetical protein [Pseudomonadales bacterium]